MGVTTRLWRIFRADLHGVMDRLEDKGLLLKQYLREMEEEIERQEARLRALTLSRDQAGRDRAPLAAETGKLDRDISAALARDREDLARLLIRRQKSFSAQLGDLDRHLAGLEEEIGEMAGRLEGRRLALADLRLRAEAYWRRALRRTMDRASSPAVGPGFEEAPEEEIELELLRRKEALKGDVLS
ncbi:MAG: PspA/IM30 family protein [Thermodesulfobacteriota bacterium]